MDLGVASDAVKRERREGGKEGEGGEGREGGGCCDGFDGYGGWRTVLLHLPVLLLRLRLILPEKREVVRGQKR